MEADRYHVLSTHEKEARMAHIVDGQGKLLRLIETAQP